MKRKVSEKEASEIVNQLDVDSFLDLIPYSNNISSEDARNFLVHLQARPDKVNGHAFHINRVDAIGGSSMIHIINYYLAIHGQETFYTSFGSPQEVYNRTQLKVVPETSSALARRGHLTEPVIIQTVIDDYDASIVSGAKEKLNSFVSNKWRWLSVNVDEVLKLKDPNTGEDKIVIFDAKALNQPESKARETDIVQLNTYSLAAREAGFPIDHMAVGYYDYAKGKVSMFQVDEHPDLQQIIINSSDYFYENHITPSVFPQYISKPKKTIDISSELKEELHVAGQQYNLANELKQAASEIELDAKNKISQVFEKDINGNSVPFDVDKKDVFGTGLITVFGAKQPDKGLVKEKLESLSISEDNYMDPTPLLLPSSVEKFSELLSKNGLSRADYLESKSVVDTDRFSDVIKLMTQLDLDPSQYFKYEINLQKAADVLSTIGIEIDQYVSSRITVKHKTPHSKSKSQQQEAAAYNSQTHELSEQIKTFISEQSIKNVSESKLGFENNSKKDDEGSFAPLPPGN